MQKAFLFLCLCLSPCAAFSQVGQVSFFVSSSCPGGWINIEDSVSVSTWTNAADYGYVYAPDLYNVVIDSPVWGGGSLGPILPNMGGNFIRGYSQYGLSQSRGMYQADSFQGHWHTYGDIGTLPSYNAITIGGVTPVYRIGDGNTGSAGTYISDTINGTPRVSLETRPRNISLIACVRAINSTSGGDMSSITLVDVSTTAANALTPGILKNFTGGDLSFWFGVIVTAICAICVYLFA